MPVLQWGMLCVLSLLLSIGFLAVHLPAALLLGPMIAGIIFSMRGITLHYGDANPAPVQYFADGASHCAVYFNLCAEAVGLVLAARAPVKRAR